MWMGIGRGPGYPLATDSRATMLGITSITASTGHSTRPGSTVEQVEQVEHSRRKTEDPRGWLEETEEMWDSIEESRWWQPAV